jgi:hypothetical protein
MEAPSVAFTWMDRDIESLRDEYAVGEIDEHELEDGLDDVFGVNGGIGHARECMIDLPSGACTCGGIYHVRGGMLRYG